LLSPGRDIVHYGSDRPNPPKDLFVRRWLAVLAGLAALMVLWYCMPLIEAVFSPGSAAPRIVTARGDLAADEKATIELFDKARASVVYISTKSLVRDLWTRNVFAVPRGTGSGFIWDEAGHVVTNYHVIKDAAEATVKLADGRDYRAALVGASPLHDLAVLKIGVGFKRPPPVPIGTSANLKVGQKVFAIGNPFGLDWTLTSGIVSALDRSLSGETNEPTIEHLIQTDAAINPGNSGGALLDSAGRLIGITTAIYSPSGASAGIGFAVPVDTLMRVVPQLIGKGKYIRPALGIAVDESLNKRLTELLDVQGVVILRVQPSSNAAKAGLQGAILAGDGTIAPRDIIVAIDGKAVDSVAAMFRELDRRQVGDVVQLTIQRGQRRTTVEVTLEPGA
jgi:S1-C subfamily serine protease